MPYRQWTDLFLDFFLPATPFYKKKVLRRRIAATPKYRKDHFTKLISVSTDSLASPSISSTLSASYRGLGTPA